MFSGVITAAGGDATTTLYLEATRDGKFPIGILTSTVDKFIRGGTTTEYVTQEIGTHLDNRYARIASTSSREYYRIIQATQSDSGEIKDVVQPTGLVHSSVSYKVDGSMTTEYHIEHYRTFLDGHYAHLMSSISKVYSDPPVIVATPVYKPEGDRSDIGDKDRKEYLFPRENIQPAKPIEGEGLPTKTIGSKPFSLKSPKAIRLDDIVDKESNQQPRDTELLENNIQVRSINQAIVVDPAPVAKDPETVPTFTVDEAGDLNIPTPPSVLAEENEIEPTSVDQRLEKPSKTSLDSVTFVGFVDFTTTIDDTVVIFSPKKTFSTATRNFLVNKIQPTSQLQEVLPSTAALPVLDSSQPEKHRTSDPEDASQPKLTSGINSLKSLFAAHTRKNPFSKLSVSSSSSDSSAVSVSPASSSLFNNRPKITIIPNPSKPQEPEPEEKKEVKKDQEEVEVAPSPPDLPELSSSIDINSDVELVYKTLYTTYTYFTTFFRASTTRIKSREEVISNVVTLTNILDPTDLASLRSSCEVDSTCHFVSSTLPAAFTTGFIGRPNTKDVFPEVPRSSGDKVEDDVIVVGQDDENSVFRTFYTTYTYFTTLFVDGTSSISTRTEVYSDVKSSGVPVSFLAQESTSIVLQTTQAPVSSKLNRLEYSSILRPHSEESTTAEPEEEAATTAAIEQPATTEEPKVAFVEDKEEEKEEIKVEVEVKTEEVPKEEEEEKKEEEAVTEVIILPTSISDVVEKEIERDFESIIEQEEQQQDTTEAATTDAGDIEADEVKPAQAKTYYTTYTYFTTLFRNGTSFVTSNLETVTNVADTTASPVLVQPSVTFFTTFTYWTTSIDGEKTFITSREETKTDILPASITDQLDIQPSSAVKIEVTQTASFDGEIDNSSSAPWTGEETTTGVPELESGETEPSFNVQSSGNTVTPSLQASSSVSFENLDDDFILASSIVDGQPEDSASALASAQKSSRSRLTFNKPSRSLTPAIRPNLFKTRARPNIRARGSTLTTVAIITRSDITPTLIATPASTQIPSSTPTPDILSSSALRSAGFLSRAGSRFGSSSRDISGTVISASAVASSVKESAIEPSAVDSEGNAPSIISGISLRRPNPFQARLKERQRQRLQTLREGSGKDEKEEKEEKKSFPIPPAPPGGNAPIFISSKTEKISSKEKSKDEEILEESTIDLPENIREAREKARSRISKLFKNRRPQFSRPKPNESGDRKSEDDEESLAVAESRRRRKRQVSNSYSEFGARTTSSSQLSRRQPQFFDQLENPPFTAFSDANYQYQNQYQSPNPKRSTNLNIDPYANNDYLYSSSSTSGSQAAATTTSKKTNSNSEAASSGSRRQVRQNADEVATQRSRSRFNGAVRQPVRSRQTLEQPTTTTTTTTPKPALRSRFRPRTVTSNSNNRNKNSFSDTSTTPNRFTSTTNRRPSTSLFDYDDSEDDYDYNVELESSQNAVPDFITVTHVVPIVTTINLGNTVKDVISTTASLEIVAATDLKSTNIDGSPVIYANAHTATPALGTQVITFDALRATETTAVEFTPTRIRGLRTSFSHAVPSTIYNIRSVTTSIVDPVDQNQLLTQLLLKLLSGQQNQQQQLPNLLQPNPQVPRTQFVTHTSTTVTTITSVKSKVLPITLRGREIKTTLVESSTEVVTITELSTETIIAPTAAGLGSPIQATANPLEGLLGGGGDLQQQLLVAQLQQQLQQQILTQPSAGLPALPNLIQPSPIDQTAPPVQLSTAEPEPPAPKTSVVTVFVSGKSPDEFTRLTSTVIVEEPAAKEEEKKEEKSRKKRSAQNVQNVLNIFPTGTQSASEFQSSTQAPLPNQLANSFLLPLPELPFDIFPRNSLDSSRNTRVSAYNTRFTLFPKAYHTRDENY